MSVSRCGGDGGGGGGSGMKQSLYLHAFCVFVHMRVLIPLHYLTVESYLYTIYAK